MTKSVFNVHEAKTHLSRLLDRAHRGEEIVLAKSGRPHARLVPLQEGQPRTPGWLRRPPSPTDAMRLPRRAVGKSSGSDVDARILLDTHALLWWLVDDPRLSSAAREAIADPDHDVLVSAASGFEISTNYLVGELDIVGLEPHEIPSLIVQERMTSLPVSMEHVLEVGGLPDLHRDPLDRMLIAQSRVEGIPLVTADTVFRRYDVEVIW